MDAIEQRAAHVVRQFLAELDDDQQRRISAPQRERLAALVREALSNERLATAGLLESLATRLRSHSDRPELEL